MDALLASVERTKGGAAQPEASGRTPAQGASGSSGAPPKVLFVTNMWPDEVRPWHGSFVKVQAQSLEELGVEVSVLSIRGYASSAAYIRAAGDVLRKNAACPYDVVHAHYGHSAVVARLQLRAPLVITYWGSDLNGDPTSGSITPKSRVEVAMFRQLARVSAATMTQSHQMERILPAGVRGRNHVVPAGIDIERFRPVDRDAARRQLGWALDEKVILFAGNPERTVKNFPLAEEVHRRTARSIPNASLRVAWGLTPEKVPLYMSAADALILSSRAEGSPNVVKEAMAAELPVVATPVGDVDERMAGVPGCYVRPADPDALTEAMTAALQHGRSPEARTAMAPLGTTEVAQRILDVYQAVLRRGQRQASTPSPPSRRRAA